MTRPKLIDIPQKLCRGQFIAGLAAMFMATILLTSGIYATNLAAHESEKPKPSDSVQKSPEPRPGASKIPPPGEHALSFDGIDDFLEVHASKSLQLGQHFTIEMWIKVRFPETSNPDKSRIVLSKGGYVLGNPDEKGDRRASPYGFGLSLKPEENSKVVIIPFTCSEGGIYGTDIIDRYIPGWQHLVLSSGNYHGVYHLSTYSPEAYTPAPQSNLFIGRNNILPVDSPFAGDIGELRIWNRELTAEEIAMYKQIPLTGHEPNLVACWTFEQDHGQDAADISPYKNRVRLGSSYLADKDDPTWISVSD